MISSEPIISVGLIERAKEVHGYFNGYFELPTSVKLQGSFRVANKDRWVVLYDNEDVEVLRSEELYCRSVTNATFTLSDVTIGINFHWEQKEKQIFEGDLRIRLNTDRTFTVINEVCLELYLQSVISSEMSAEAPFDLLKAHAITSRSWLVAMLERQKKFGNTRIPAKHPLETADEIIRWHDREDHAFFDVCADDHCQRYQGITKIISNSVKEAIEATRGTFLVAGNEVCDARFSKACGGRTELFESCWEVMPIPYLQSVSDSSVAYPPIMNEVDAERWITSSPDVYCNTTDGTMLQHVLPSFDRETTDFFRWKIEYSSEQLEEILHTKSEIDFGTVMDIIPLKRGPSGRIIKLKIVGSKRTMIVGKELEIRRWLSKSHLYSSAFIVKIERDMNGLPEKFAFHGAGWGHGVGLCQIGAAVMASKGFTADEIIKHYFRGVEIRNLY
ncbi:MAG: SpoIID/LytB domain-containing protein [Bacteroidota bacterium]